MQTSGNDDSDDSSDSDFYHEAPENPVQESDSECQGDVVEHNVENSRPTETSFSDSFLSSFTSFLPVVTQESGLNFGNFNEYRMSDFLYPVPNVTQESRLGSFSYQLPDFLNTTPTFGSLNPQTVTSSSDVNDNFDLSGKEDEMLNRYGISSGKPKHPQYSVMSTRYATFSEHFPKLQQTPNDLAEAGFFYSGQDDIVYCFFCGQGLRSWEPEDIPWVEHAKFSPSCGYLLNMKGHAYVRMVQQGVSKLRQTYDEKAADGNQEEPKKTESMVIDSKQLLQSIAAQSVLQMGYSTTIVEAAIKYLMQSDKNTESSTYQATDIMEAVLKLEEDKMEGSTSFTLPHGPGDVESLLRENKELRDRTPTCKVCVEEKVSIVFLPCGHLCCCGQCASALTNCPICRQTIKGSVKAFL